MASSQESPTAASLVMSQYPGVNLQFMTLIRAIRELQDVEPGTAEFRRHLVALTGLLRYQFAFEEEMMDEATYLDLAEHIQAHNTIRRTLAGLVDFARGPDEVMREAHRRLRRRLEEHVVEFDNEFVTHLNRHHEHTTLRMHQQRLAFESAWDQP